MANPKLAALIAEAKRKHAEMLAQKQSGVMIARQEKVNGEVQPLHIRPAEQEIHHKVFTDGSAFIPTIPGIDLNERQLQAVELAMRGKSFNLIGAAGTGKTTTTREVIGQLTKLPHISPIQSSTKYLAADSPGIVVISFTNKAVNNLKKFLPEDLKKHCMTYHKLLQYEPVKYETELGSGKYTMRFEPYFNGQPGRKLPHISCIVVEEGSMVADDLHKILLRALPNPEATQFIFLGDLNQLPPIFGPSILGFKLIELPTVELTHVYRQALESPIITLAHKIREGRGIGHLDAEKGFVDDRGPNGKVSIRPWKKKMEPLSACKVALANVLIPLVTSDGYDFSENMILCPFNKTFGTIELNRHIADALAKKRGAEVYEVIGRYTKSYWAVGDRVLFDRQEAVITKITPTAGYTGPIPRPPSKTMDRTGKDTVKPLQANQEADRVIEAGKHATGWEILDEMIIPGGDEETKNEASHQITLEFVDTGAARTISAAGDVNSMLFSYVLTVHKSQGSEWKRVFIILHRSHNTMLSRELLYTAITRARHELFIVCEPDRKEIYNSLTRASKSPEIQGVTLEEKSAYFRRLATTRKTLRDKMGQQRDVEAMEEDVEGEEE